MSLVDDSQEGSYTGDEYGGPIAYTSYPQEEIAPYAVHQCNVCNKIFMNYKGLQQHSVIHTDTKPFVCEVCGRGFRFKSNMFEHRTVHTGYTPHLCPFCGKQFRLKGNMKKHMRVHVTNKEELEAAYRPYSRFERSNRRSASLIPDNALVIRGSPMPFFNSEKRKVVPKLQLGRDTSKWISMICQNQLLPISPFNEKMIRMNMRLSRSRSIGEMIDSARSLEFELFYCPLCKCECTGREECEAHLAACHGKKPDHMLNEPSYCRKCMRLFADESMFIQHQSYHSRVQVMFLNRQDSITPEVDVSQMSYCIPVINNNHHLHRLQHHHHHLDLIVPKQQQPLSPPSLHP
ncbi:CRE-LSL-1 protein [Caenorhabditis remanei]|uniref:CRE-LSL-1 protein n=1 Tax=Caenorhabditis remanei TaxID=31234 RepID=E3M3B0_CAERE|nr:CRE-LSL-1 protein [Caenorhabditis remanei]